MFTSKQKLHQTMVDGGGCVEFQPMDEKYAQVKSVFIFRIIGVKSPKWNHHDENQSAFPIEPPTEKGWNLDTNSP